MDRWKRIFAISVLTLFLCVPQAHSISQDEYKEFAEEEKMAQALDAREDTIMEEEAKEDSYVAPQDDSLMEAKEGDRAAIIREEGRDEIGQYGDQYGGRYGEGGRR